MNGPSAAIEQGSQLEELHSSHSMLANTVFWAKSRLLIIRRLSQNIATREYFHRHRKLITIPSGSRLLATDEHRIYTATDPRERALELGKVQNLRIAAAAVDGIVLEPGETFSFWLTVGRPSPRKGYVIGRELRNGCMIDYRVQHLVVAQSWLPWLNEAGALGGRSFDVVMSRYPLEEIHRLLDTAAAEIGASRTIADFRADPDLVSQEAELLARARRIITPHHGIASLFPDRAMLLAWHRPKPSVRKQGSRIAYLGPTIARQRPDIALTFAKSLTEPLIIFGPVLEPFWDGFAIEKRSLGPGWLDGLAAILHPATLTNQPRKLLDAVANEVPVYATRTCGLAPADYRPLETFPAASGS